MCACVHVEHGKKVRKTACECPSAYMHTTHTQYPHVLDPYICILFFLYPLCLSFHFSSLSSTSIHAHTHTRVHALTRKEENSFHGDNVCRYLLQISRGSTLLFSSSSSDQIKCNKERESHTHGQTKHTPSALHSCVCETTI